MEALGLVETKGLLSAIVAADVAVKAANVTLLNAERIKGGYVTVQLVGDVGAVKAAVDAATEAIKPFGNLISSHVIPRMHSEITWLVSPKKDVIAAEQIAGEKEVIEETILIEKQEDKQDPELEKKVVQEETESNKEEKQKAPQFIKKELEQMTVADLRKLVRKEGAMSDDKGKIKYATKATLVNSLLNKNNKPNNN